MGEKLVQCNREYSSPTLIMVLVLICAQDTIFYCLSQNKIIHFIENPESAEDERLVMLN